MTSPKIAAARALFPAALTSPYLNVASRGILARPTRTAVDSILDLHERGLSRKEDWAEIGERARSRFATMIGAKPSEIAFTKNTAEGLNIVARAIDWQAGDNVVLCPELEHPNNIYAWLNLRRFGVEVRTVAAQDNALDIPAMVRAIDQRTRIVTVASVTFTPGFRTDLSPLAQACRAHGAFLNVDAVQSLGVLDLDVEAAGIDGLSAATSKGLCGLYGQGFLYVRQSWLERLEPPFLARFSVDQGGAHESEMGSLDYKLLDDARRFEIGHYNFPGVAAIDAALGVLLDVGVPAIEAHALALSRRLADGLAALQLPVCSPPEEAARTHIVTVGRMGAGGAYSTADDRLNAIARALEAAEVRFSVRRGLLRFATHVYNAESDIDRVLEIAQGALGRAAAD